jgi:hypothetical protein
LPARRTDALAVISLLILAALLFADVLLGTNGFYFRDLTRYYYPAKQILRDVVAHGELPYWNRFFAAGQPLAANPEHEVFYPLTWLVLLPDYNLGFRLLILIHIGIALCAMYALLRSMELRPIAAWLGAASWGLGGVFLSYINLLPILFSAAWLPLTCLFVRRFLLRRNGRDFALGALFLGVQFLVGEPTTVLQTGILLGMYALYRAWYDVPRSPKPVLWIAAISAAAFAVGAAQMLAAIDHVAGSVRAHALAFDVVSVWSLPPLRLGELVYPNLLGHLSLNGVGWYWGGALYPRVASPFLGSLYAGLLVAALAIGGAFVRARGGRLVLILCTLSAAMAFGANTPLLGWIYRAGIGTSLRYPEKFALLGVFPLVVFAAQMFERMMNGDRRLRGAAIAFLGATTAVALAMAMASLTPLYRQSFAAMWDIGNAGIVARMVEISRADWIVAAIRGAIAIAIVAFAARNGRLWMLAAASFLAIDLAYTLEEINPRMPRRFFDPPPIAAALPANRADFRLFPEADWYPKDQPPAAGYFPPGPDHYWSVRNALSPMLPAAARIQTVLQNDPDRTELLPTHELTTAMIEVQRAGRADWQEPFMAMSNAWFRTAYRDFQSERRRTGGDFTAMKPVRFLAAAAPYPRYYFADQIIGIRGRRDVVEHLLAHRTSPRVAFVEAPAFAAAPGVVRNVVETPNTAALDVESAGRGFLVMSVTRHKYWDVRIDGVPATSMATNLAYQGIAVPPGRHRVTMVYRNPLVPLGLGVSAAATALFAFLAIRRKPAIGDSRLAIRPAP